MSQNMKLLFVFNKENLVPYKIFLPRSHHADRLVNTETEVEKLVPTEGKIPHFKG